MLQFLNELFVTDRNIIKSYKDFNIAERRRKENQFGPYQGPAFEFFRSLEQKERAHVNLSRFLESMIAKIEQLVKT